MAAAKIIVPQTVDSDNTFNLRTYQITVGPSFAIAGSNVVAFNILPARQVKFSTHQLDKEPRVLFQDHFVQTEKGAKSAEMMNS